MGKQSVKQIASNRKAFHDYFIEDKFEAGIELAGTEVKSIRLGNVNLKDSFCLIKDGEISVLGMHISPYEQGNRFNPDPVRPRRLLMHKREILKLDQATRIKGYTLVPVRLYLSKGLAKLEVALAKGRDLHDKRENAKARDAKREIEKAMKSRIRN